MICLYFANYANRDCLIVGGGDVAERKARLLLDAGARLTVNALAFIPQFTAWADAGMLTLVEGPFDEKPSRHLLAGDCSDG
uniref:NAD(P)-dependent oxidoreductase n=1 Tax=Shigella flexneri TaxID=623 RepID=UPI0035B00ED0